MPYLSRTDFVLQTSKQHFDSIPETDSNKSLLGVYLAFLVCVSFYSEMEGQLVAIVRKRLSAGGDKKLANLILSTQGGILRRIPKSDLAECALFFGGEVKEAFNVAIHEQDVAAYSNLITQRHYVSHDQEGLVADWTTANLSLVDVEKGLGAAERLLAAFEVAIQ